jgi:hypothetical protein
MTERYEIIAAQIVADNITPDRMRGLTIPASSAKPLTDKEINLLLGKAAKLLDSTFDIVKHHYATVGIGNVYVWEDADEGRTLFLTSDDEYLIYDFPMSYYGLLLRFSAGERGKRKSGAV